MVWVNLFYQPIGLSIFIRPLQGKQKGFEGLATNAMLLQFGKQRNRAIERFQEFVSQGGVQEIWCDLKHQIYLGDKKFVEKHMKQIAHQEDKLSEVPLKQRRKPAKSLQKYQESNATVMTPLLLHIGRVAIQ